MDETDLHLDTNSRNNRQGDQEQNGNYSDNIDSNDSTDGSEGICSHHLHFDRPHEHLLSDHTSIDVLILDREMKNVLTNLETFGFMDEDYKSLALTSTAEEEKVDDSEKTWPSLPTGNEGKLDRDEDDEEQENDWEVVSTTDSVWTIDTFEDAKSFRDALLESTSSSMTGPRNPPERVSLLTPSPTTERDGSSSSPVVNLEMLESADLWTSIRDAIKNLGGGKPNLRYKGNKKNDRGRQWPTWDKEGHYEVTQNEQRETELRCRVFVSQLALSEAN